MNDTIAKVLIELNSLFDESLSLQAISDRYDEINDKFLRPLAIKVKIRHTKEYAIDEELNSILEARRALKLDYRQSMLLNEQQEKLLEEKGLTEATQIRMEPSGFVYEDSQIVVYLNPVNANEELIAHLITKNRLRPK
jgi:hypothetical protein